MKNYLPTILYHSSNHHLHQLINGTSERNIRERSRMKQVNECFLLLRKLLPYKKKRNTRVPKELVLRLATKYIAALTQMIKDYDEKQERQGQ